MRDALSLFREVIARLNSRDFLGAATLCDSVSLRAVKRELLEHEARIARRRPPKGVADRLLSDPSLSQDAAEAQAARDAEHYLRTRNMESRFDGIADIETLRATDATMAFAAYLSACAPAIDVASLRLHPRATDEFVHAVIALDARRIDFIPFDSVQVGPSIVHILYRQAGVDEATAELDAWSKAWMIEERERVAALPDDERALHEELRFVRHPMFATCRRQSDGSYLMLAVKDFVGYNVTAMYGWESDDEAIESND